MKKLFPPIFILLICSFAVNVFSQDILSTTSDDEENNLMVNDAEHPCITEAEYKIIENECNKNIQLLGLDKVKKTKNSVALEWPLQAANGLNDYSYYHISAYVDLNAAAGAIQDNNCGTNTYDAHRGTDISIWPYNFLKMDNNMVEVIAAAPGTIIAVHDGEFDKNCAGNTLTANYIMIQHEDGSSALYWHMKKNSVTTKTVGQTVDAGEYLGVVGSSGSSSGPHLHFEVRTGTFDVNTRVDPFSGACNSTITSSWWANQKSYKETAITKISVNSTDAVVPTCPGTEIPNESNVFAVPFQGIGLAPGYAKFYIFIRDEVSGLNADLKILNPNGSTFNSWTYNSTSNNKTKMWGFSKLLPTNYGIYTFQAQYNGITTSTQFEITATQSVNIIENSIIKIFPNPSNGKITIEKQNENIQNLIIYNVLGNVILEKDLNDNKTEININANGLYFYKIKIDNQVVSSGKLVVE